MSEIANEKFAWSVIPCVSYLWLFLLATLSPITTCCRVDLYEAKHFAPLHLIHLGPKKTFFGKLAAKPKFWAPKIFSVGNSHPSEFFRKFARFQIIATSYPAYFFNPWSSWHTGIFTIHRYLRTYRACAWLTIMPGAGIPGGCGDKMTWVSMPFSSTICCTMWPGGTCIGIGTGGPLFDTIRTVAGPSSVQHNKDTDVLAGTYYCFSKRFYL